MAKYVTKLLTHTYVGTRLLFNAGKKNNQLAFAKIDALEKPGRLVII